ncbi:ATP-binding protein [Herbaspirillum sp. RTI4]|uniref:ATP-binding protein n=1 Tax=Herbaspirillum sp. RTI4 TaxID=3048640 RepID=UPI002AB57C29|nr:ATP-binding protein [Herbaspirillum sp. RTI4]MDY7578226.1 ATP-binding protein [Herbaspirillum sp. RTI4]MEA9981564.1 ATP-binding protein [Herbaspirillum sp. RTI4]
MKARWLKFSAVTSRIDVRLLLGLFAAVLIAIVWLLTLLQLNEMRKTQITDAQRDVRSLARVFQEHAARTLEAADQASVYLRYRYNIAGTKLNINQDLKEGLGSDHIYNLFSIVDEKGDVVLSSKPFVPVNLSDREHIRVHMITNSDALYVSKPLLGRVSNKWSIQMTRRINHPDGTFKGVVVVSMDPQYFTQLYYDIDVGRLGTISIVGADGIIRVRRMGTSDSMGQNVAGSPLLNAMLSNEHGAINTISQVDNRQRIYAYEKLRNYPLYVSVGIDLEERLAPYYVARKESLFLAALISATILLFSLGIIVLVGKLIKSRLQAVAANDAKFRFLANMSHEFRTPLNGILGYSETLSEDLTDEKQAKFAKIIHDCGMRLLILVDAVLEMSALETETATLFGTEENLSEIIRIAVHRYQNKASVKNIALDFELAPDAPKFIVCDNEKLSRVLDSLLDNAVKFTEKGRILLKVGPVPEGMLFQVIDSGVGVAPELQKKIFEKFSQADDSPARAKAGAGLGLSIAARLIEMMGGHIFLESKAGNGSIFSFTLPHESGRQKKH